MMTTLQKLLGEAAALTRNGRLIDATETIRRTLGDAAGRATSDRPLARAAAVLDGLLQAVPSSKPALLPNRARAFDAGNRSGASPAAAGDAAGRFVRHTYSGPGGSRDYKLYVPSRTTDASLPLIVMLHGCTQDPDDFAAGTRMNDLAEEQGFVVLYPAQAARSNASKCWNWFMPGDQQRGHGEPALLAGMTEQVINAKRIDPNRVYIAGLSAGAAMAAIMGREYPNLYAAVGIHSGLPQGAAHDVASAFSAMKSGTPDMLSRTATKARAGANATSGAAAQTAAPVIVFHGDRDATVHPSNGVEVISALLGDPLQAAAADGATFESSGTRTRTGGHDYTRTLYRRRGAGPDEPSLAEHWLIHGGGHAWSGGSPSGSYTDAAGPDASREMLRFFTEHPRTQSS